MDDQSRNRALFDSALRAYKEKTGITLAEHSLATQLQSRTTVESITALIQNQVQVASDFGGTDRIMNSIGSTISILATVFATDAFEWVINMTFSPRNAIHAGLAILLVVAKGVETSYDLLANLLGSIEHLLRRIEIYTQIPHTPVLDEMVVRIMVELISTLALATKGLMQGRSARFLKKRFGEKDVEAALQRLDRLTQDEARTTAAQTLKVVHALFENMNTVMSDDQPSVDGVREALRILHNMASEMDKSKRDKLQRDINTWLSPPDPWKNHHLACELHHAGTAAWLVQGRAFSEWKTSGPSSLLWLHGKPGAGKSVLCSTIIKEIDTMRECGLASLAFHYHDFREDEKRDRRGLLSSMLFQLCDQSNSYFEILSTFYSGHRNGVQNPSDDELAGCLKQFLELPGQAPVYLIIDALDECQDTSTLPSPREKVLQLLEDLVHSRLPNLRICVTSRPEVDIKQVLKPLTFCAISIHDESGQMHDIENYIKSTVNSNRKMRRWKHEHKQLAIDVLTERADGMFRWAYCQLEYLSSCLPGSILHALDYLPETLDGTYERTLRELKSANWEFARRLFLCVAAAKRPLRVEELAEFLAFDFRAGQIPTFHEDWRLEDPLEAVVSTCSTLLVLVHTDDSRIIQFSHYSVKEFLTSTRFGEKHNKDHDIISHRYHISMTSAHALIAQACFGILLHLDKDITRNSLRTYPLAKYAAKYWVEHVRFDGVSENVEEGMKRLLDTSKPHLAIWIWLCILEIPRTQTRHGRAKRPLPSVGSLLQYAVEHLRDSDVHAQQGHGADAMAQEADLCTPLLFALLKGLANLTRWLVKYGANAMAQDKDGSTPLRSAMETVDLARLFVRHYADGGSTPLLSMVLKETVDALRKFVEQFPDVNAQNNDTLTQLLPALQEGSVGIACMLVKYGADVTALDDHGWTPLHWAVEVGSMGLTRLFIEYGADVQALANDGSTPLGLAVEAGRDEDLVAFLADHAVDTTAQAAEGSTSFNLATQEECMYLTPLLAGHGADAPSQDAEGTTPLHLVAREGGANLAVEAGREDLAPLLAPAAYATAQDIGGFTPLNLAAHEGSLDPTHLTAEYGADATAQDADRSTLLHLVVQGQNLDLARLLIEHGVDVTAKDNSGLTPLHWAVQVGSIDLARLFIRHGASVTAQDNGGLTPLDFALETGREDLVCLLVDHIMDATAQDADESTRLDLEVQEESVEPTNLAPEHGANAIDGDGSAVSQSEVDEESADHTRIITEHDADATVQDPDGSIPLHSAVQEEGAELQPLPAGYITGETAQDDSEFTLSPEIQDESGDPTCLLVENSADATARDGDEATPLHSSVQEGSAVSAHLPVEEGRGMTTEGEPGSSPLHIGHGTQDNRGRLRRIMHPFLSAYEVVLVGVLFYCIVALKSYWL